MIFPHLFDILLKSVPFLLCGNSAESQLNHPLDLYSKIIEFIFCSQSQSDGAVVHQVTVEKAEGLGSDRLGDSFFAGVVGVGLVEEFQEGVWLSTHAVGIKSTAVSLFGTNRRLIGGGEGELDHTRLKGDFHVNFRHDW